MTSEEIRALTDDELVVAANELMIRANARLRRAGVEGTIVQRVWVYDSGWKHGNFEIDHVVKCETDGNDIELKGGNIFQVVAKHERLRAITIDPPQTVVPSLAGPPAVIDPGVVYADFTEVHDDAPPAPGTSPSTLEDDVPF